MVSPTHLLRHMQDLCGTLPSGTTAAGNGYYVIRVPEYTCNSYTNSMFRRYDEPSSDPVWLFGNWWAPALAAEIKLRVLRASWEAIARIKYHARNLFLERHVFEIRQPCWGSGRWRSVT